MTRGLSHLPVAKGTEPEFLNRELVPYVRDLEGEVAALGPKLDEIIALLTSIGDDDVAEIVAKLEEMIVLLDDIKANQAVPAGGAVLGFASGIASGSSSQFPSKPTVRGITIINLDATNNLLISKGVPAVGDPDTLTVKPGTASPFLPCTNANQFNLRSSASTVSACHAGA